MQILTNSAQIDYQYNASGKTMNIGTKTNYVTTNISKDSINLLKTSNSNYYAPGERINYNIFIANSSDDNIYNVSVIDNLPNFLKFVENSATFTNKEGNISKISQKNILFENNNISKYDKNLNKIEFVLGNLSPKDTAMISYSVMTPSAKETVPDIIETYANLSYSNKLKSSDSKIVVKSNINSITKAYALITAEKIVDKTTVFCGDKLQYTISLNNKGNIDATNVRITDILPNNFKLEEINFTIADLPYSATYKIDENNILSIPADINETGLCIPANTSDNSIVIKGEVVE